MTGSNKQHHGSTKKVSASTRLVRSTQGLAALAWKSRTKKTVLQCAHPSLHWFIRSSSPQVQGNGLGEHFPRSGVKNSKSSYNMREPASTSISKWNGCGNLEGWLSWFARGCLVLALDPQLSQRNPWSLSHKALWKQLVNFVSFVRSSGITQLSCLLKPTCSNLPFLHAKSRRRVGSTLAWTHNVGFNPVWKKCEEIWAREACSASSLSTFHSLDPFKNTAWLWKCHFCLLPFLVLRTQKGGTRSFHKFVQNHERILHPHAVLPWTWIVQ